MWKWEWQDDIDHVSETSSEGITAINPDIESCCDEDEDNKEDDGSNDGDDSRTHTVTSSVLELHIMWMPKTLCVELADCLTKVNMFQST